MTALQSPQTPATRTRGTMPLTLITAPPMPARRAVTALESPEQIRAHMRGLRAANAREDLRMVVQLGVFVAACTLAAFVGIGALRVVILLGQG